MNADINTYTQKRFTKRFYKENGLWYIDLPEFLNAGLGSKANLLMVDGSDKMLDILSRNTGEAIVQFSDCGVERLDARMEMAEEGLNQDVLDTAGHAPIGYGRYYNTRAVIDEKTHNLRTWLCPVAEWVFGGHYPKMIDVQVVAYGDAVAKHQALNKKKSILDYLGF